MKIKTQSSSKNKRKIILIIVIALLFVGGLATGAYAYFRSTTPDSSTTTETPALDTPATPEQIEAGDSVKEETVKGQEAVPNDGTVTVSANVAGDQVRVLTQISKIMSDGSCSLTFSNSSATITKETVGIQALPGYSTCKGWTVPTADLTAGEWTVTVTVTSDLVNASATTKVTI